MKYATEGTINRGIKPVTIPPGGRDLPTDWVIRGFYREPIKLLTKVYQVDPYDVDEGEDSLWQLVYTEALRTMKKPECPDEVIGSLYADLYEHRQNLGVLCRLTQRMMRTLHEHDGIREADANELLLWQGHIDLQDTQIRFPTAPQTSERATDPFRIIPAEDILVEDYSVSRFARSVWETILDLIKDREERGRLARCEECQSVFVGFPHQREQSMCSRRCRDRAKNRRYREENTQLPSH